MLQLIDDISAAERLNRVSFLHEELKQLPRAAHLHIAHSTCCSLVLLATENIADCGNSKTIKNVFCIWREGVGRKRQS